MPLVRSSLVLGMPAVSVFITPPGPTSGCQPAAAKKAALHLANGKLSWKWQTSGVLSTSDFGNPPTTTDYLLCFYDGSGRRLSATAPAGRTCGKKPCWRTLGGGFSYKDKTGTPDGLMKLLLKSGDAGRGKIAVKGGGANLRLPALPLTTPVRAQLAQSGGSTCWEATYSSARTNTASAFNAKSD